MLYDEINYILYTRKPVKILDLNGFIIYLYYLARTTSQMLRLWYNAYYAVISATTLRPSK